MKTRIIAGLCMLPLLAFIILGGIWLKLIALVLSIIAVNEFYKGFEAAGAKPSYAIGYSAVVVLYLFGFFAEKMQIPMPTLLLLWAALSVIASMVYGFDVNKRKIWDMAATLFGILYAPFLFYHVILVDESAHSVLIWIIFLAAFGTDICAYFAGVTLGKHKLCPVLSPKKSVEGAVGGVLGSVVLCTLFGLIFVKDNIGMCVAIGFFGSIVAQLGDLSASAFKRQMGIKDYGKLIPGHGGILDRFDSVLFVAPVVYYVIVIASVIG